MGTLIVGTMRLQGNSSTSKDRIGRSHSERMVGMLLVGEMKPSDASIDMCVQMADENTVNFPR